MELNGVTLKQIFLEEEYGIAKLAGIEIEKDGKEKFLRLTEMHTTLGYRAEYVFSDEGFNATNQEIIDEIFNKNNSSLNKKYRSKINRIKDFFGFGKINTKITTASGMSMNLILNKTAKVRNLI